MSTRDGVGRKVVKIAPEDEKFEVVERKVNFLTLNKQ